MTTASRSRNNGNAPSPLRLLTSGALAHEFTTAERRRGAKRTNEIKRERAAKRRRPELDRAEELYLLTADRMLLLQTYNRLSQELGCSDCRHALVAAGLVLKHLAPRGKGIGAAASAINERIRELGFDEDFEAEVARMLQPGARLDVEHPAALHPISARATG